MSKPRVVSWNTIPSPYSVDRFNEVADRKELNFEAWFTSRTSSDRSWEFDEQRWRFKYRYLRHLKMFGLEIPLPPISLLLNPPDVLAAYYAGPVYMIGIAMTKLRRRKAAIWCLLTFESWSPRSWWKELLKHLIYRSADGVLTIGPDSSAYAVKNGASPEAIFQVSQAFDVNHFASRGNVDEVIRDEVRQSLHLKGTVFVYVGRLWRKKGLDTLFDAYRQLVEKHQDKVSLLLMGNGEDEEFYRQQCVDRNISNVVFGGFVQKSELPAYYAVSDVSVFPTLGDPYGLVVDEALAASLPVISSDAAGEIRGRVEDLKNGFIVPVGDSHSLFDRMDYMVTHPQDRLRMADAALPSIASRTPEQWSKDFEVAIAAIVGGQRKDH